MADYPLDRPYSLNLSLFLADLFMLYNPV